MAVERTFAIIKPDAVKKKVAGQILARIEECGLEIIGMKKIQLSEPGAKGFYAVHKERPFYPSLIQYITSSPVVILAVAGPRAIEVARKMMGATFGWQAESGTIRGDFGISNSFNLIHGSDSAASAKTELARDLGHLHSANLHGNYAPHPETGYDQATPYWEGALSHRRTRPQDLRNEDDPDLS